MVEFAIVAVILLMLFLGTVDYARFLYYDTSLRSVTRVGAETAINRCLANNVCSPGTQTASVNEILWSIYCEARPFTTLRPTYGVYGTTSSTTALGPAPARSWPALPGGDQLASAVFGKPAAADAAVLAPTKTPTPVPTPAPTATPLPGPGSSVCFVPPGQSVNLGGAPYLGDVCATACATSDAGAVGQNGVWDMCVEQGGSCLSSTATVASGSTVTVVVGYHFQPVTFVISQFFPEQSCYPGDVISKNHHNLCFSSTALVS